MLASNHFSSQRSGIIASRNLLPSCKHRHPVQNASSLAGTTGQRAPACLREVKMNPLRSSPLGPQIALFGVRIFTPESAINGRTCSVTFERPPVTHGGSPVTCIQVTPTGCTTPRPHFSALKFLGPERACIEGQEKAWVKPRKRMEMWVKTRSRPSRTRLKPSNITVCTFVFEALPTLQLHYLRIKQASTVSLPSPSTITSSRAPSGHSRMRLSQNSSSQ